jgi:hypothetical protein
MLGKMNERTKRKKKKGRKEKDKDKDKTHFLPARVQARNKTMMRATPMNLDEAPSIASIPRGTELVPKARPFPP